uniref:cadherin-2-like n=1 Tax=Myxine glutinosa TaxID=7769 RepID=UPI00358E3937
MKSFVARTFVLVLFEACVVFGNHCTPGFEETPLIKRFVPKFLHKGERIFKVPFESCGGSNIGYKVFDDNFKVDEAGWLVSKATLEVPLWGLRLFVDVSQSPGEMQWTAVMKLARRHHNKHHKHHLEKEHRHDAPTVVFNQTDEVVLHSKHRRRQKRSWVIPPINEPEHSMGPFPKFLVPLKSDEPVEVRYSITGPGADQNPEGLFIVDAKTGKLSVTAMLDWEHCSEYKLQAHAVGVDGSTAEEPVEIIINVLDINDHLPEFIKNTFDGFVVEGSTPGTNVFAVRAEDKDDPKTANAMIRYSILSQKPQTPFPEMFTINGETGMISTMKSGLNREQTAEYQLIVEARDMMGASHGLATTATAIVKVTDVNDNLPEFTASQYAGTVKENTVGKVVANLSVTDSDERNSPAWKAKYTVIQGDPKDCFLVKTNPTNNDGMVTVVKPLDFEAGDKITLVVQAENLIPLFQGGVRQSSTATVTITVTDLNEPPIFDPSPHSVTVSEDVPIGKEIIKMVARDPDKAMSQQIRYAMRSDPLYWLSIDPISGAVTTQAPLDREHESVVENVYKATVLAIDNGNPVATGTGTLLLKLSDVNDNNPVVSPEAADVCEGSLASINISATDKDLPPNTSPFIFKLDNHPDLKRNWTLTAKSGEHGILRQKNMLPIGVYNISLEISDSGTPARTGTSSMILTVCQCEGNGVCSKRGRAINRAGFGAFGILGLLLCLILLIVLVLVLAMYMKKAKGKVPLLRQDEDDDLRDNILKYDEEGGGEEDQDYDPSQLQPATEYPGAFIDYKPVVVRRDQPVMNMAAPRFLPRTGAQPPNDIGNFIDEGLKAADDDPSAPPYDSLLVFDCEGAGSFAGSLSSVNSGSSDNNQEYDHLKDWGPRFRKLADMYGNGTA